MSNFGNTIVLEPNSLYVSLTQLMTPGFHWSIYISDGNGGVTRYHWRQVSGRRAATDPIEYFTYGTINPVTEMTRGNNLNLAFIKISSYAAPLGVSSDYLVSLFQGVFPISYASVRDNRRHRMSCRTWVMSALQSLRVAGLLRLDTASVASLEAYITAIGNAVESRVALNHSHTEITSL